AVESERNLCRLRHPNIVRFLHIAQPEPATVIVFMELLDGRSLERFIDNKPLEEPKIRDFSEQICRALLYLHSRQPPVIHRDINCSNIIVCADNTRVKLIDFGLSIKLEQSVSHMSASTQSPKGTLNFMAPELLGAGESDSVQYSRESDIWAFGCSVFQMASGARPFANARSLLEMVQLIDRRGAPALSDGLSAELRDFYSRCTDMDRKSRKSVQELLDHEFFIVRDSWDFVRFVARGFFGDIQEVVTDRGIRCAAKTLNLPVQLGDQKETKTKKIDKAVKSERNLCRLRHPNIVRFLHIAQPEPATVIVFMELLDGRSLERFIDNKPLEEPKIRDFSEQICRALLYLHSRQPPVIHRDINCSNIIVCADNTRVKLIDFGLSIKLEQSVSHMSASTQSPKGTLNFMAPELLGAGESDSVQYSRESDIWAFGCSVFQMASGARPFANARSLLEMVQLIDRRGAPALSDGLSAELRDFYSRCTDMDRKSRKSVQELLDHEFFIVSPVFRDSWDFVRFVARGFFGDIQEVVTDRGIRCAAKTLNLPVQLGDQKETKTKKIDKAVKSERNLCRLRHPNIVRFLHIAQPEPATVIVFMELLDGRSLERFIDNKPLEEPKIRDFSEQICRALLYLHSRQPPVIHRDINCSNIIVCADNTRVKLIDFGLSIKLEQSVSHMSASTQSPKGTLNFMAPELLGAGESDSVQYSRESDIWAFGCSVFQMASGARPFRDAQDINQVADRIRNSGAPAMPDGRSAELQDFYSHCTAKDRRERHSAEKLFEHDFLRKNSGSQR
uniref:Protein kinase domain-containing protein n=1 Tax=Macrostomum lignano TaxID=282301 RepID=A0A1I8G4U5_9PLAT